jgi:hypothetical protein
MKHTKINLYDNDEFQRRFPLSGRTWPNRKRRTSDLVRLDVRHCQREGLLKPDTSYKLQWALRDGSMASITVFSESGWLILSNWHQVGEAEAEWCPVSVEWTRCNYGGLRAWFLCPVKGCQRRVLILYAGRSFACRHCYQLRYDSQLRSACRRALYKARAIRIRLGGSANLVGPPPSKPKGMHSLTYSRLCAVEREANLRSFPNWLLKRARLR